jgi:chromosome segregation protein
MYLSKLDIFGFKSFANKTSIHLNDGITAIVGPNGCGKTNIVDALRWALGEQRSSTLRSDKMENVIFNGTKSRKPINIAEVSLTIENNKGILPLEFNEVTVTRRLYRSGESEYQLNRVACRLKDIVGLFMDTGMGANAYSVIELKMVETILSDKLEERRKLFEEAAGVTRYKTRRKEALRKLDEVEGDLLRVDDIMTEVGKSVAALNRQAKRAERYNELQERLRALEIDVMHQDYTSMFRRLEPLEARLAMVQEERDVIFTQMNEEEGLVQVIRGEERDMEALLDTRRAAHMSISQKVHSLQSRLLVGEERRRTLKDRMLRLTELSAEAELRKTEIEEQKMLLVRELEATSHSHEGLEAEALQRAEEFRRLEERLSVMRQEADSRQRRRLSLAEQFTRVRHEVQRDTERMGAIEVRLEELRQKSDQDTRAYEAAEEELAKQSAGQIGLSSLVIDAEREFHRMEDRKQELKRDIDALQNRAFELQGHIGEKMTRIDFLTGLVDRLEGYSESVQHLLRNTDWSASRFGTVADAVNTRDEYRVSIEAALGDAAHYIIVKDIPEALGGLAHLRHHKKGKATFVCLSQVPRITSVSFPIAGDGVLGWAIDLVAYEQQYADMLRLLLRYVLIVRDPDVAHACIKQYPDIYCVTLAGDVFTSRGLVRGGSHGMEEGSLIGKREQIKIFRQEAEALKRRLEENQNLLEAGNAEYAAIDLRKFAERMKQSQQDLSAHERRIAQMTFAIEEARRALRRYSEEQETLVTERTLLATNIATRLPLLEDLRAQSASEETDAQADSENLAQLEREHNTKNEEYTRTKMAVVESRGILSALHVRFDRLRADEIETEEGREAAAREIADAGREIEELRSASEILSAELAEGTRQEHESAIQISGIEEQHHAKRAEAEKLDAVLHTERQHHAQTVNVVHEMELKISEIRQRIVALEDHARNEFEIALERRAVSDEDVFDLAQAKAEIDDLKIKIKALGLVNPLAFEEWKEEKDRLDLLVNQRSDLVESRLTLTETIREINETAKRKFIDTFGQIRTNFITIFKSLFDEGDEADLLLDEVDDPLEARIEIIAKPRGKRPHSIEMLSGGEKTLTAIALLFAIYLVKPSPFCILDEVDAPLDDANTDRFIRILRDFSVNTQFIVVTHNKRTMAAADTLYGVTMEEEGVSKLVAVDFNRETIARFAQN